MNFTRAEAKEMYTSHSPLSNMGILKSHYLHILRQADRGKITVIFFSQAISQHYKKLPLAVNLDIFFMG